MQEQKVIVIGGGIGGLATAALLGKKGYDVTLLEKNDRLGGRAMVYKEKGFTFDLGPSWYLMPDVFERFFALFDKKPEDFYTLKRLDPQYRVFFSSDHHVDIHKDLNKNLAVFDSLAKGSGALVKDYLDIAKYQYEVAMDRFVYKNYDSVVDILDPRLMMEGTKLKLFTSLNAFVSQYTESDKIKKILQYTTVFLGGSPQNTPAFYSIMSHIDFHLGVFYPQGGIGTIITALEKLCRAQGVKIELNQDVTNITVKDGKAQEVQTKDKAYPADIVISNADYPFTEMYLLPPRYHTYTKSYWERKTMAPSAFLMYLGIKGKVEKLQHHTLFFADKWEEHFTQIFDSPDWPNDPSYYVCCPSKTDSDVAPTGHENVFVLVPVASGLEDTPEIREHFSNQVLSHLESLVGESIKDRLVIKKIHAHNDFSELYHAYKGTALGLAHTLFQTAILRPKNRSPKVPNLYYVGQYTNPGIGLPMCLISAELTSQRVVSGQ